MANEVSYTVLKPDSKSRITNGHLYLRPISGRTRENRRFRDLVNILSQPFGGWAACDVITGIVIRRVAAFTVHAEKLETVLAAGEYVDPIAYATITNSLRRYVAELEARKPKLEPEHASPPPPPSAPLETPLQEIAREITVAKGSVA